MELGSKIVEICFEKSIEMIIENMTENIGKNTFDLTDLAKRAVLLDMIISNIDEIKSKNPNEKIKASHLYKASIDKELFRKDSEVTIDDFNCNIRLEILEEISVNMFVNEDKLVFTVDEAREYLKEHNFCKNMKNLDIERYLTTFLTFTFLIRESDYTYRFSHKSFRDYLVARYFVKEIESGKLKFFAKSQTTQEINNFITEQEPDKEKLLKYAQNSKKLTPSKKYKGTNSINILLKLDRNILSQKDFSYCEFYSVDFGDYKLKGTSFNRSILNNCKLDKNILETSYQNANFYNSSLFLSYLKINNLDFLKDLTNIIKLFLSNNQITNIEPLKNLTNIQYLDLSNNQITDIEPLKDLSYIEYLYLSNNPIPKNQIEELEKCLPETEIVF